MHLLFSTGIDKKKKGKSIYHSDRLNSSDTIESHLNDNKFISQNESNWIAFFLLFSLYTLSPCGRRRDDFNEVIFLRLYLYFKVKANKNTQSQPVKWQNNKIRSKEYNRNKNTSILFVLYVFINMDVGRLMNIRIRYTIYC